MTERTPTAISKDGLSALLARIGKDVPAQERAAFSLLVNAIAKQKPVNLPPQNQSVTILMADLRGFSALVSSTDPQSLVEILQPFFADMTTIIHENGGHIDKFLGDGVMALFGAPTPSSEHAHQAVCCAAQMQRAMNRLNQKNHPLPPMYVGIGLSSGQVMAGSFGSDAYSEYTVIGDTVNIAARLEKLALRGEVLLSDPCLAAVAGDVETASSRDIRVRGQQNCITVHNLKAVTSPTRIEVPEVDQRTSPRVNVNLPLLYHTVENQRILPQEREGSILNLGYGGMLAKIAEPLPERGEIIFGINTAPTAVKQEDVYARALHHTKVEDGFQTAFAFTSIGEQGREAVHGFVDQMLLSG